MRFFRVNRYADLPHPTETLDHEDDEVIAESDLAFDRLAEALSTLYLVDDGDGQQGAPIHMYRYVDPCRHHTVVIDEAAWHVDVISTMIDVLSELPDGWTFGVDATEFPPGQAHLVVNQKGEVYGWAEYRARRTLESFGFEGISSPFQAFTAALRGLGESFDRWRRRQARRMKRQG